MLHQSKNSSCLPLSVGRSATLFQSKITLPILALIALCSLANVVGQTPVSATSAHTEAGFADADLYECVINNYNTEFSTSKTTSDVLTSAELASIKNLDCRYGASSHDPDSWRISSTSGIQQLAGLEKLYLYGTVFPSLDLSSLTRLKSLSVFYNDEMTTLDISHNSNLEEFMLWHTSVANTYDFTPLPKIRILNLQSSDIEGVNIDNNPLLEEIILYGDDEITELSTINNPELKSINIAYTKISSLDTSNNPKLKWLELGNTRIASINTEHNTKLEYFTLDHTSISNIDLSHNQLLKELNCRSTNISVIDVQNNPKLSGLNVPDDTTILDRASGWYDEDGALVADLSEHDYITKVEESSNYRYDAETKKLFISNPSSNTINLDVEVRTLIGGVPDDKAVLNLQIVTSDSGDESDPGEPEDGESDTDTPDDEASESDLKVPDTGSHQAGKIGATFIALSLSAILAFSTTIYLSHYTAKRHHSKVDFKK